MCIVGCLSGERIRGCFTPLRPSSVVWSVAIFHKSYVQLVKYLIRVSEAVRSAVVSEILLKPAIRGCVAQVLRFDRFAITVSTERVAWWIQRRFHHRVYLAEPSDAQTAAPRPHTRVRKRPFTLGESARRSSRERSFRPFRRDRIDGANRLVDRATVTPPCILYRAHRCPNSRFPPTYTRTQALLRASINACWTAEL